MNTLFVFLKKLFSLQARELDESYLDGCADIYELEHRLRNLDRSRRAHSFQLIAVR